MRILDEARDHPIRAFALICVAAIAVYIGWMAMKINDTLAGAGWCRTALGAEKISGKDATIQGLEACVGLLQIQLKSLATNSHILFGSLALCLVTLIVIVVAKGKLAGEGFGAKIDLGGDPAARAADEVAGAAIDQADEIKGGG